MRLPGRQTALQAALLALVLAMPTFSRADPAPPPPPTPFAEVFAGLAARLVEVVVNISTTQASPPAAAKGGTEAQQADPGSSLDEFFRDFFADRGAPGGPNGLAPPIASLGSGFIIDPSGLIVTNNHVIANAGADHRNPVRQHHPGGARGRARCGQRPGASEGRCQDPAAGGAMGRFDQDQGRRLGTGDRQPVRARRHRHLRHHLGDRARHPCRPV